MNTDLVHRFGWTLVILVITGTVTPQDNGKVSPTWDFEEARQFDFWIGEWDVNLRIKQEDLSWQDKVKAQAKIYRVLDGKAIVELWNAEKIKGFSLRHFDRNKDTWILYLNWPGKNRSGTSSLEGRFRHGRGEFFSTFTNQEGEKVISRYTFCDITPTSLRWDDAYSSDGGKTWSNNWIMEFTRTKQEPIWPAPNANAHTYETGECCDLAEFREFEILEGRWNGQVRLKDATGTWREAGAALSGYKILDGCGVMNFVEYELDDRSRKSISVKTFNTYARVFEDTRLDNAEKSVVKIYYGKKEKEKLELVESGKDSTKTIIEKFIWRLKDPGRVSYERYRSQDAKKSWQKVETAFFEKS